MKNVIKYRPFLIKPNNFELGELFSVDLHTDEEIIVCAKQLEAMGARNVLVSLGGDGALLLGEDGQSTAASPRKARWSTPSVPATAWSLGSRRFRSVQGRPP